MRRDSGIDVVLEPVRGIGLRVAGYIVLAACAIRILLRTAVAHLGTDLETLSQIVGEDGALEWLQVGVVSVAAVLALFRGRIILHRVLGLFLLAVIGRELDRYLEHVLFDGAHKFPMFGFLLVTSIVAFQHRAVLRGELAALARRPAFAMFLFGGFVLIGYSQLFGEREIWKALSPQYSSEAKRVVEEGLELLAYLWVLFGTCEETLMSRCKATPAPAGSLSGELVTGAVREPRPREVARN